MARELKFRSWSIDGKDDYDVIDADVYQYTGIVDVNGTEIYEGDIVRMHVIILSPDDKVGVVSYSPQYGYSIHFTSGRMARQEYWATEDKHTIEVIGNVHDNAELLGGFELENHA
ncbi:YopX family protein [Weissella confusa]|uniref:YopX family protein n=1 Tax=Weissella confusa TaxID=1583 RepID=UPI00189B75F5|nr:YopX family protein [Weissella confusa]